MEYSEIRKRTAAVLGQLSRGATTQLDWMLANGATDATLHVAVAHTADDLRKALVEVGRAQRCARQKDRRSMTRQQRTDTIAALDRLRLVLLDNEKAAFLGRTRASVISTRDQLRQLLIADGLREVAPVCRTIREVRR
jgi:hypothetical protein